MFRDIIKKTFSTSLHHITRGVVTHTQNMTHQPPVVFAAADFFVVL